MPEEDTAAGMGRLLGTNALQTQIDALGKATSQLSSVIDKAANVFEKASATTTSQTPGGGNGGPWNSRSNYGGGSGRKVGGDAAFTATQAAQRGMSSASGSGGGNGGNATYQGQQPASGSSGGGGGGGNPIQSIWNSLVSMGNKQLPVQTAMNQFGAQYSINMGGGSNAYGQAMQMLGAQGGFPNRAALSSNDLMQGTLTAQSLVGGGSTTSGYGAQMMSGINAFAIGNPSIGIQGAASMTGNMMTPAAYLRMQSLGMGTTFNQGGTMKSMPQLANQVFQRTFQGRTSIPAAQLQASSAPNGSLYNNLMMATGGDSATAGAMLNYLREQNQAALAGMSPNQFQQNMSNFASSNANTSKNAANALRKVGLGPSVVDTMWQNQKNMTAQQTASSAAENPAFVQASTNVMHGATNLASALRSFINAIPGARKVEGWLTGGAATANSNLSGGGPAFSSMGSGFPPMGSSNIGGGQATGGGSSSGSPSTESSGASNGLHSPTDAETVIRIAERAIGLPYKWGGSSPADGGMDCSGLIGWAFRTAGWKNVPTHGVTDWENIPGFKVPIDEGHLQPGDLLLRDHEHIEMYVGNGQDIAAKHTGTKIGIYPTPYSYFDTAWRVFGSVGTAGGVSGGSGSGSGQNQTGGQNMGAMGNTGATGGSTETSEQSIIDAALSRSVGGMLGAPASSSTSSGGSASQTTGGGTNGGSGNPANMPTSGGGTPAQNKLLGQQMAASGYGWTGTEWQDLLSLWMQESGWNQFADNKSSGAYGIPQSLPASKMASAGSDYRTNPATQIKWGLGYIKGRYGDPVGAWAHEKADNWYDVGAWSIPHDANARVHEGEMIIPPRAADTIRAALLQDALYKAPPGGQKNSPTTGTSGPAPVNLTFSSGSVVMQVQGTLTQTDAVTAANAFAKQLQQTTIIQKIAAGVTSSGNQAQSSIR